MRAELFQFFVQRKTGWLGSDLKQHAAGLAEIDGMKISAIDHRRDVVAEIDEMLAPLQLFRFVLRSKGNMMHRTGRDPAHRGVGLTKQINMILPDAELVPRGKAKPVARFFNQTIAEAISKSACSSLVTFQCGG